MTPSQVIALEAKIALTRELEKIKNSSMTTDDDIVTRLRVSHRDDSIVGQFRTMRAERKEAAAEIERLRGLLHYANGTCDLAVKRCNDAEDTIRALQSMNREMRRVAEQHRDEIQRLHSALAVAKTLTDEALALVKDAHA